MNNLQIDGTTDEDMENVGSWHGGVTPAKDGASRQAIEDMGVMRTIPNMTVIMPADYWAARKLTRAIAEYDGSAFIRFTRDAIPIIYDENT